MAVQADFRLLRNEDANLTIALDPPTAIGGWTIDFRVSKRIGGSTSGLPHKTLASGFSAQSGITILNSGAGIFRVHVFGSDMSGKDAGNWAWRAERTDSGSYSVLALGTMLLNEA